MILRYRKTILRDWRYWYRRYLGWLPVQFCMVCGSPYWGGFPRFWFYRISHYDDRLNAVRRWHFGPTWLAWWKDYCSQSCCDIDQLDHDSPPFKYQ